jgi:Na+/H+ antiporter NhaD/arsenite permease-like protein
VKSLRPVRICLAAVGVLLVATTLPLVNPSATAQTPQGLVGLVNDEQGQPIEGAQVTLLGSSSSELLASAQTQKDGRFLLPVSVSQIPGDALSIQVQRPHFETTIYALPSAEDAKLQAGESLELPTVTMARHIGASFWIASATFILVLVLIAMENLQNTLAVLVGTTVVLGVSYLGAPLNQDLFIFNFARAVSYIDWNVVFLIMGMMIFIAVVEGTGLFQWLGYFAYRVSGGRAWLMLPILMITAGIVSAFLDNVTTMLLMAPISIQIAMALGVQPLALLVPEVLGSNVIGISTLIGTPTNILVGSAGKISFSDFLVNLTPGVLIAMAGLIIYCEWVYWRDLARTTRPSQILLDRLRENAQITQPEHLKKVAVVGGGMLLLFIFGERFQLVPSVTALIGATALLLWIRPDIEAMIEAVDWTTLVFFIGLFIVVGAIQEVGLVSVIAVAISGLVGQRLLLATLAVIWTSALLSTVIANIPLTAAMLPVISFLSGTVPGASNKVLYYSLSVGSALGGNGSLIGASANLVTAGIADRAGYPISYLYFLKRGLPALVITVASATLWLYFHFLR